MGEIFIYVHNFTGFGPWFLGPMSVGRASWCHMYMAGDLLHLSEVKKQSRAIK
jgi:hypothetical protein